MGATNGHRHSVGRVVGLRNFFQSQNNFNHLLDLIFFSAAITGQGLFDLEGGVFVNFESASGASQQNDAARLTYFDRGFDVFEKENIFYRDNVRPVPADKFIQLVV
jgi:hypothetical protein